jgi:hypothetical protein
MKHKPLLIALSTLVILHSAPASFANQQPSFKHFSDYTGMSQTASSNPATLQTHYVAMLRVNDRAANPAFEDNTWMLAMRRGLYLSEVEKAMSEIYMYFLDYSTDVDLVEDQGDYYVAGRKFKNFTVFDEAKNTPDHLLIQKKQGQFYVGDYLLTADGYLIEGSTVKQFRGLAGLAVLTRFFGVADATMFNYGLQENETELRAIQFDNESGFLFNQGDDIENDLAKKFGSDFIQMPWYQNEKRTMQEKIANTDFSIIEKIVRSNISVSQLDEMRWTLNKILKDPTVLPEYDRKKAQHQLDNLNKMDESKYGVDKIIQTLKIRQQQLRKQLYTES